MLAETDLNRLERQLGDFNLATKARQDALDELTPRTANCSRTIVSSAVITKRKRNPARSTKSSLVVKIAILLSSF
jgi:hypothetical protein